MPGRATKFTGYVTTFESIAGKSALEVERSLGFNRGALKAGYFLFKLAEGVALTDFQWKDRTTYSDGWHYDPSIDEYVQRDAEVRNVPQWELRKDRKKQFTLVADVGPGEPCPLPSGHL